MTPEQRAAERDRLNALERRLAERERLDSLERRLEERERARAATPTVQDDGRPVNQMTVPQERPDVAGAEQRARESLTERYGLQDAPNAGVNAQRSIEQVRGPVPPPEPAPEDEGIGSRFARALGMRSWSADPRPLSERARALSTMYDANSIASQVGQLIEGGVVQATDFAADRSANPERLRKAAQVGRVYQKLHETRDAPLTTYGVESDDLTLSADQLRAKYPRVPPEVFERAAAARAAMATIESGKWVPEPVMRAAGVVLGPDGNVPPEETGLPEGPLGYAMRVGGGALGAPGSELFFEGMNAAGPTLAHSFLSLPNAQLYAMIERARGAPVFDNPDTYVRGAKPGVSAPERFLRGTADRLESGRWFTQEMSDAGGNVAETAGVDRGFGTVPGAALGMVMDAAVPVEAVPLAVAGRLAKMPGAVARLRGLETAADALEESARVRGSAPPPPRDPTTVPRDPPSEVPPPAPPPRMPGEGGAWNPDVLTDGATSWRDASTFNRNTSPDLTDVGSRPAPPAPRSPMADLFREADTKPASDPGFQGRGGAPPRDRTDELVGIAEELANLPPPVAEPPSVPGWRDVDVPPGIADLFADDPIALERWKKRTAAERAAAAAEPAPAPAPEPAPPPPPAAAADEAAALRAELDAIETEARAADDLQASEAEHFADLRELLKNPTPENLARVRENVRLARARRTGDASAVADADIWKTLAEQEANERAARAAAEAAKAKPPAPPIEPTADIPPAPEPAPREPTAPREPVEPTAEVPPPPENLDKEMVGPPETVRIRPSEHGKRGDSPQFMETYDAETGQRLTILTRTADEAAALNATGVKAQHFPRDAGEDLAPSEWRSLITKHTPARTTLVPRDFEAIEGQPYVVQREGSRIISIMDWQHRLNADGTRTMVPVEIGRADSPERAAQRLDLQRRLQRTKRPDTDPSIRRPPPDEPPPTPDEGVPPVAAPDEPPPPPSPEPPAKAKKPKKPKAPKVEPVVEEPPPPAPEPWPPPAKNPAVPEPPRAPENPDVTDPGITYWVKVGKDIEGQPTYYGIADSKGRLIEGPFPESWLEEQMAALVDAGLTPDEAAAIKKAQLEGARSILGDTRRLRHEANWTPELLDAWRAEYNARPPEQKHQPYGVFPRGKMFSIHKPDGTGIHPRAWNLDNPDAAAQLADALRKLDEVAGPPPELPKNTEIPGSGGRKRIQRMDPPEPAPPPKRGIVQEWWDRRPGQDTVHEVKFPRRGKKPPGHIAMPQFVADAVERGRAAMPALHAVVTGREFEFAERAAKRIASAIDAGADPSLLPESVRAHLEQVSQRIYGAAYRELAQLDGLPTEPVAVAPIMDEVEATTEHARAWLASRTQGELPNHGGWRLMRSRHAELPAEPAYTLIGADGHPVPDAALVPLDEALKVASARRLPDDILLRGDRPVAQWSAVAEGHEFVPDRLFSSPREAEVIRSRPSEQFIGAADVQPLGPVGRPLPEGVTTRAGHVVHEATRLAGRDILGTDRLVTLENGAVIPRALVPEYTAGVKAALVDAKRAEELLTGSALTDADVALLGRLDPSLEVGTPLADTPQARAAAWRKLHDAATREVLGEVGVMATRAAGSPGLRQSVLAWLSDAATKGKRSNTGVGGKVAAAVQRTFVRDIFNGFVSDAVGRMPAPVRARWRMYETEQAGVLSAVVDRAKGQLAGDGIEAAMYRIVRDMAPATRNEFESALLTLGNARLEAEVGRGGSRAYVPYQGTPQVMDARAILAARETVKKARGAAVDWLEANIMARGGQRYTFRDQIRALPASDLDALYREVVSQSQLQGPRLRELYARVTHQPMRDLPSAFDPLTSMAVLQEAERNFDRLIGDLLDMGAAVRRDDPRVGALRDTLTGQAWRLEDGIPTTDHAPETLQWAAGVLDRWGMTPDAWKGMPEGLPPLDGVDALLPDYLVKELERRTGRAGRAPSDLLTVGPRSLKGAYNDLNRAQKAMMTWVLSPAYIVGNWVSMPSYLVATRGWSGAGRSLRRMGFDPVVGELLKREGARIRTRGMRSAESEFVRTPGGAVYHIDELAEQVRRSGIGEGGMVADQGAGLRRQLLNAEAKADPSWLNLRKLRATGEEWATWIRDVANAADSNARISTFVDEVRNGRPLREAADIARDAALDFNNLTPFESAYMRNLFTFYAFVRRNHDMWLKSLFLNPSRALGMMRLQYDAWNRSDLTTPEWWATDATDQDRVYVGSDETPEDNKGVRDMRLKRTAIGTQPMGPGEFLNFYTMLAGLFAPGVVSGDPTGDMRDAQFMINPLIAAPVQAVFAGGKLDAKSANKVPAWVMHTPWLSTQARWAFDIGSYPIGEFDPKGLADPLATAENNGTKSVWIAGEGPGSLLDKSERYRARRAWQFFRAVAGPQLSRGQDLATLAGVTEPPPYMTTNEFRTRWALGLKTRPVLNEAEVRRRTAMDLQERLMDVSDAAQIPPPSPR